MTLAAQRSNEGRVTVRGLTATREEKSTRNRLPVLVTASCVLAIALATVGASKAFGCSKAEGQHCYALTEYIMDPSKGEAVYGAYANMELFYGTVPSWEEGDFETGEMWVGLGQERWMEGGATIGHGWSENLTGNGTTPYYFVARSYGPKQYYEFDWYGVGPGFNNWYGLYISEQKTANGNWCTQWAWDKSPDFCWNGFQNKSTDLETGMEYATSPASGPTFNGRSVGWQEWTNWTWHAFWYGAYNKARPYYEKPLCINAPAPGYTYGSVAFATGC